MQLSIIAMAIIPAMALTATMLWAIYQVITKIVSKQPIGLVEISLVVVWLLGLNVAVFLVQLISAALSHSEAAKSRIPVQSVITFVAIVVIPTILLLFLRSWSRKRSAAGSQNEV
jgi:hypothetical protein